MMEGDKKDVQNLLETDIGVIDRARNSKLYGPLCINTLHDKELCACIKSNATTMPVTVQTMYLVVR